MDASTYRFEFRDLNLSIAQIESVMGYKEEEDSGLVSGLIGEAFDNVAEICNIRAQYIIFDDIRFDSEKKALAISDQLFEIKGIIYNQIRSSDSVAIFMCTAGKELGLRSSRLMKEGDFIRGYVYDIVGSEIVEAAADLMQADLEKNALLQGHKITNRYSPGYCGWDVVEQKKLFTLLSGEFCGIRLTESALMDPVKSVSGIIGIGANVRFNPYTCQMCNMKNCTYNRGRNPKF
jgi:cobalamin-dependent methionine synthase I